ncbi:MAG: helix-turn-helix domain-containing protein [Synergistaceae bacterium]|nr:helix-turn-helix domain-containing protein [Synergistaceae bacterium]
MHASTAQNIAESTNKIIGYGVLVTDNDGIIIGCSDVRRVGNMHEPSLEVVRTALPVTTSKEETSRTDDLKPGYTCPIILFDEVVGTISIAGPPRKVERYGLLVQKQAEIMLKEQSILEAKLRKEQAIRDLARSILLYKPEEKNENSILLNGRELGYKLERCRIAVVVEISPASSGEIQETALCQVRRFFADPAHLISSLAGFQIVLFLAPRSRQGNSGSKETEDATVKLCRQLIKELEETGIHSRAGVGVEAKNLPELALSARSAREALRVGGDLGNENEEVHSARSLVMERFLAATPRGRRARYIELVFAELSQSKWDEELLNTFLVWCENPFSPKDAAKKLSIHRNTLQFRLKKLRQILGLDPWNFHDSFVLWTALILRKFEERVTFFKD